MEDPRVAYFMSKGLTQDQAVRKLGLTALPVTPVVAKESPKEVEAPVVEEPETVESEEPVAPKAKKKKKK